MSLSALFKGHSTIRIDNEMDGARLKSNISIVTGIKTFETMIGSKRNRHRKNHYLPFVIYKLLYYYMPDFS